MKIKRVYQRAWVIASNRSGFIVTSVQSNGFRYFMPNRISRAFGRSKSIRRLS